MNEKKRIIIAISGASGTIYAVNLLQKLHSLPNIETHVIMSDWAKQNFKLELDMSYHDFCEFADYRYNNNNLGARIASGSFLTDGMVIIPASMKTVAGIACGFSDRLIGRAADVILKEQRKLIVVPRESPLSTLHLENLTKLSQLGAHIIPPIPAFYNHPQTIQDLVDHHTVKILDSLGISYDYSGRWEGQ